ncbi:MAG TPA: RHS repeat-associated core domain-containing protein, partial [Chitinophagaceae bacterium]|nr:RHS repeat-associated core domain-containing protein [Chitinophagaceae bacterium]
MGGVTIHYSYDAAGNRVVKEVSGAPGGDSREFYIRDAQGNTLALYRDRTTYLDWSEQHLYGSSRLGIWHYDKAVPAAPAAVLQDSLSIGSTAYELTNHLGNVLSSISDKKIGVSSNSSTVDYYAAEVLSQNDYYPFGMTMPGRSYNNGNYRYGFNGKEKLDEIKGVGNSLDFGARIQDPRLGRWLSVDPEAKRYPGYSSYSYALNTPISATDPDGKLIIFIGGLRLWVGQGDQKGHGYKTSDSHQGIYNYDIYKYWSTDKNSFGRKADIAGSFINRINDKNAWYTSGSS